MADKKYLFFNRELSWIEFNARVLSEAENADVPLFEQLRFLSIVTSNFDEFFMVRVASIMRQNWKQPEQTDICGYTANEQLQKISARVHELTNTQYKCLHEQILPKLSAAGIEYVPGAKLLPAQKNYAETFFINEVFPLLTPMKADPDNFPHLTNLRLHAAFLLNPIVENEPTVFSGNGNKTPFAIVQIPTPMQRIIWLPSADDKKCFTLLEDIILEFGTLLFQGYSVKETLIFQITRDADSSVDEDRDNDFIQAMEEVIEKRKSSFPVRMCSNNTSPMIRDFLMRNLMLNKESVYETSDFVDLTVLNELYSLQEYSEYKYKPWKHFKPQELAGTIPWDVLKQKDILLHVPYESYEPVEKFLSKATEDPDVLAIKITLYRTSGHSPIIKSLERAAKKGKHVTAFVELKARFDEQQNISWASRLEQAGVIVIHGIANLKVHAKLMLIIRKEIDGIHRYVHLSTGNYNDETAKFYSDLSIFTSKNEIANDATLFFNMITGYSAILTMKKLAMSPVNLKSKLISMIDREAQLSTPDNPGLIMAKMNSLGHEEVIRALYRANAKGVNILLNVRGICMLVPGVKGQSENITVVSIIDRYLEHSRIFYFQNAGDEELYLSSADWMPRNLDKRVELMFPVTQKDIVAHLKNMLSTYFADNVKAHKLTCSGSWVRKKAEPKKELIRAQEVFYNEYKSLFDSHKNENPKEFTVRRSH